PLLSDCVRWAVCGQRSRTRVTTGRYSSAQPRPERARPTASLRALLFGYRMTRRPVPYRRPMRAAAVLAPGYGGTAEQPIVRAMAAQLEAHGLVARAISYSRARPGGDLRIELDDVRLARDALRADGLEPV